MMIRRTIVLLIVTLTVVGCRPVGKIRLGTGGELGHYYKLGKHLDESSSVIQVRKTNGSTDNLQRLENGELDFAFIQSGIPTGPGIVTVATVADQYVHLLVRKDSPYSSLRDLQRGSIVTHMLDGKEKVTPVYGEISIGSPLSGTEDLGKRVLGYTPGYPNPWTYSRGNIPIPDNPHDAIFTVYSLHAPALESVLSTGQLKILSIDINDAIAHTIPGCEPAVLVPGLYGADRTIPAEPTPTLKVKTLLVTRQGVSARKVKHMLRTLYRSKHPDLVELTEKVGAKTYGVPLHPAAEDYYQRNEPLSSDKFEIGGVILAGVIFLGSLMQIVWQRIQVRKLNKQRLRIQPYFDSLRNTGLCIQKATTVAQLEDALETIMTIQSEAEKPWLRGELDTEHMENLYAVASARSSYAESKLRLLIHNESAT